MRLTAALQADIRFQFRYFLYYAYIIISFLYILLLHWIPNHLTEKTAMFLLFSDCSFLGAFFIGGIVLLEKEQGIYDHLFITPMKLNEFIWAKVFSLGVLSLASSLFIFLLSFGLSMKMIPLLIGIAFNSIFASLLGLIFAARVKSINQYLMISPLFVTIFFLPILSSLHLFHSPLFYLLPSQAGLLLMEGAFTSLSKLEWLYAIGTLLLYIGIAYKLASHSFYKHIILKIGG
ncbi:ABC transporter permease [Bacillus sp. 03113]|uniref:fluoroquinolone export ABC transporter permease subunit n=1 Tax=Bacillus sp. 03113 TaxID=2578211 RepID=UPI001141480D|nr:ABC transporter permease [Bacillus sp. 03113]